MKKLLSNKKYSGILLAIVITSVFVGISLLVMEVLRGTPWFLFSTVLRLIFGIIILLVVGKLYGRSVKDVLSFRGSKKALIAGTGFFVYFVYYLVVWCSGIQTITGLTTGLLISKVILQQIATGFYEELAYRTLILEGYFYGPKNIKTKLFYGFTSFLLFGALHVVGGWNTYGFLQTGIIGFSFAVIYLKSRNIVIPMLSHFVYDIFANLAHYIEWNKSNLFVTVNSVFEIVLAIMFVISLGTLLMKGKNDECGGGNDDKTSAC